MLNMVMANRLKKKAEIQISQLDDGKTAVEIAAQMYQDQLPGKSEKTAMMMAECVQETVHQYYDEVKAAFEDYESWSMRACDQLTSGMGELAAYNTLYQVYVGAIAAVELNHAQTEEEKAEAKHRMEEASKVEFTEVTPEMMKELKANLAQALKDAGIVTTQLNAMMEQIRNESADSQMVVDFGNLNRDVMTVLAMQTYLDVKNGLYPEIPANVQLEEITRSVCMAMDTYRIAAETAASTKTEEEGIKFLGVVGSVAGFISAAGITSAAAVTAGAIVGMLGIPYLGIVASVITAVAIVDPVFDGMMRAGEKVGNFVQGAIAFGIKVAVAGVKLVLKGLSALFSAAVKGAKAVVARIKEYAQGVKETAQSKGARVVETKEVEEEEGLTMPMEPVIP